MGITRLADRTWLAVPMMAATIGLAAPAPAQASTVTVPPAERPIAASAQTEIAVGSTMTSPRPTGRDRYRSL